MFLYFLFCQTYRINFSTIFLTMGKVLAFINQKGGVGKTTSAVNVGLSLAVSEIKTLIVDLDPQANATIGLSDLTEKSEKNIYDVLINNENINENLELGDIESNFYNFFQYPEIPFPDALLRTAGEKRISNFLLYQLSYSELIFIDALWPDVNEDILDDVLLEFNKRNRTYGRN